ncbi:MAG: transmembrane 220 family protein [Verrucomicrobiota bacterium]
MRIAKLILTPLWLLFAYFQINDTNQYGNHDPWFWILFYLFAASLTAASLKFTLPPWLLPATIGFCLGAALFRMQNDSGSFDFTAPFRATAIPSQMTKATQQPNEIGGLLLVATWLLILHLNTIKQKNTNPAP